MIRNNETWELGDPEMNERGQPVIHDIASRLGCIRPSPDLPRGFPEGAEDFAELQAQLEASGPDMGSQDRKNSEDSAYSSPALARTDRASSSESDHSNISKEYNQMAWAQQQRQAAASSHAPSRSPNNNVGTKPTPLDLNQQTSLVDDETAYSARASLDTSASLPSPIYTDFNNESPLIRNDSPFSPWSAGDDFLGPAQALDLQNLYMRQQHFQSMAQSSPLKNSMMSRQLGVNSEILRSMQIADGLNFADGTIRPDMLLDCSNSYNMDQMNVMFTGDYEHMSMV